MDYYVVDVFSEKPCKGNPVAVFFVNSELTTETMLAITTWLNLAETTFITHVDPQLAEYNVRIFEASGELDFAGHPSIGSAVAVKSYYNILSDKLIQHCGVGPVPISFDSNITWLSAPDAKLVECSADVKRDVEMVLGIDALLDPIAIIDIGPIWLTVLAESADIVSSILPNMSKIENFSKSMNISGINIAGKYSQSSDYKIRTLCPGAGGPPEDPICGSGNIALANLLRHYGLNEQKYTSYQGQEIGRDGKVFVVYDRDENIKIGGYSKILSKATFSELEPIVNQ